MRGIAIYKSCLILHGCGDVVNGYEGFSNQGEEIFFREGRIFAVDLDTTTGKALTLGVSPMRVKNLKLERVTNSSQRHKFEGVSEAEGIAISTTNRLSVLYESSNTINLKLFFFRKV
uniref:Uncharacterized protein n=1 Tax=Aplanochytrium stocchinoi TaxID=215587 RepID=A0A7S3PN50_9STRA|mmetsp:Transcript_33213/g.40764  ORF Transcript_33213/g.40764 Transcript_33213/m.40764 type:complete len:117 (+) Transcript_33213:666-1016(+)